MGEQRLTAKRQCNLDLLRIVSMLMIIFLHSIDHSGVLEAVLAGGGVSYYYVYFGYALVQVCVNCYVLISGYFLVKSKFKLEKLFALWMEVVFYSFTIKLLFMAIGAEAFSVTSLVSCFVPVFTGRYWFVTIYFGMYIIAPFLNIAVNAMNKKTHFVFNVVLFVLMSCFVSVTGSFKGMNSGGGWGLAWFVVLYFVAAWIRLYYTPNYRIRVKFLFWLAIPAVMTGLLFVANSLNIPFAKGVVLNWYRYDSVPVYIASILIFVLFLNIRFKQESGFGGFIQKAIVFISPLTFGVYLIHAHANISPWSWEFFPLARYTGEWWFPLAQSGTVLLIFVACAAIDCVRKIIFVKIEKSKFVTGSCDKLMRLLDKTVEKFIT